MRQKLISTYSKSIILSILFAGFALQCFSQSETYDLKKHYPRNNGFDPVYIGESPMNEATVQVFEDGVIKIYHTPERYSDKVQSITSIDGGYTWSEPSLILQDSLIWQYPRRTLIDRNGDIHLLVFRREDLTVLHCRSEDGGETWTPLVKAADGRIGAIRGFLQTNSGRLVFAFHRHIWDRTSPNGASFSSSVYSDDGGRTWTESPSKILAPVYKNSIVSNYGAVEPNIVQLKSGVILMLARTQTGFLFQSISKDNGETWSEGKASIFHSSNSPANFLKLPDGRLVLTWCNTVDPDINSFGKIYTHRDILHMAISDDDGRTWRGGREIMRIPTRNDQNDFPRGDSGVSYPNTSFTKEGKIILVTGQGEFGGGRAIWLIDPKWLYATDQEEDFSGDLEKWSCYTFTDLKQKPGRVLGPRLLDDPTADNGRVLHVRKDNADRYPDAAVWNFPMGRSGTIEMRVKVPENSKGCEISLIDSHRHPNDRNGITKSMFSFLLHQNGPLPIKPDEWHVVSLKWDMGMFNCSVYVDGEFVNNLRMQNQSGMGISYIRFHSSAGENQIDKAGLKLDWIKTHAEQVHSLDIFE